MLMYRLPILLLYLFCVLPCSLLEAQPDNDAETIGRWYLEQRFMIADNDLDGTLDPSEIKAIQGEFAYYLNGNHYDRCDLDHDGILSKDEINQHAKEEWEFRTRSESQEIEKLKTENPGLANPDVHFLMDSPVLASKLLSNYTWTSQHADVVASLMGNRSWVSKHPALIKQFHHNFRWLTDHPNHATRFYKMKDWGSRVPELREWRRNHQSFLSAHPNWADGNTPTQLPTIVTDIELDITDNNSIGKPGALVSIPDAPSPPLPDLSNQFVLEDSIRILRAQLGQARLNAQRKEEQLQKINSRLELAESKQNTDISQMRSERQTLISTAEKQRKEIQDLNSKLQEAEERLNYYIDLSGSSSDVLREENVQLKTQKSQLEKALDQLKSQKEMLADRIKNLEEEATIPPTPASDNLPIQPTAISQGARDSLIRANNRLEQDIAELGTELLRLADEKSEVERERDTYIKRQELTNSALADKQSILHQRDSLLAVTTDQSTEIRSLNIHLQSAQGSIEDQLRTLQMKIDSVVGMNNMLSVSQAEMKQDLRRLVRENALLANEAKQVKQTPQPLMTQRSDRDSLLFETTRRQREVAMLKKELQKLQEQLNQEAMPLTAATPPPAASGTTRKEAELTRELATKTEQLENMTDKFIDMADEMQAVRSERKKLEAMKDSLLLIAQGMTKPNSTPAPAIQPAASTNKTIASQRIEIADLKRQLRQHESFADRNRIVFDSLIALTAVIPELQAGMMTVIQPADRTELSQPEVDLKRAEQKIKELEFERQKLQEQLKLTLNSSTSDKDNFESRVEVAQATIRELNTEVKKLQAKAANTQATSQANTKQESLRLEQEILKLQQQIEAQNKQLAASNQFAKERKITVLELEQQVLAHKSEIAQLSAINRTLNDKLSTDMIPQEALQDSMRYYKTKLSQINRQVSLQQKLRNNDRAEARRQIETLEHQITQLEMKQSSQTRIEEINKSRIDKIEQQEAEIKASLTSVGERENLLRQQESYIMGRLAELDTKEKRYQHLLQLEKELRLLEQQLKQHPDYEKSRNQAPPKSDR